MKLTLNLAGSCVSIIFLGQAKKGLPFCHYYFKGFLHQPRKADAKVEIRILKNPDNRFFAKEKADPPIFEQLLPAEDAAAWLKSSPEYKNDFPITEGTISSYSNGGLLLFNPDTSDGSIYLIEKDPESFKPLHRLLWIYFAQVLGEKGGCFLHATALSDNGDGHVFMGESGAGKSTLSRLCPECRVLSDDGPILLKNNGQYRVYPSPYHQMNHLKGLDKAIFQKGVKASRLYFLVKDDRLFLARITKRESFSRILMKHIHFFPYLSVRSKKILFDLLFEMCHDTPTYNLHFCEDQNIYEAISTRLSWSEG